jgi:hypothetical protein
VAGVIGLLLDAQRRQLVGADPIDDAHLVLGAEDDVAQGAAAFHHGVAGGGEGVLGQQHVFFGGEQLVVGGGGGLDAVGGLWGCNRGWP